MLLMCIADLQGPKGNLSVSERIDEITRPNFAFRGIVGLACPAGAAAADAASNGKDDILLGMSTALSGPAGDLGTQAKEGILAGLERANRAGGVNGRHLRLVAIDDGGEPARTASNTRLLLQQDSVLAVIGSVGAPNGRAHLR